MASPTRSSRRVRKRVNYREVQSDDSAGEASEVDAMVLDDPKPRKKSKSKSKAKAKLADDSDHESGPKRKRAKLGPSPKKVPALPRDIWLMVFEELASDGSTHELGPLLGLNKFVGSIAAEVLYKIPPNHASPEALAKREVTIFRSLTPYATMYTYHTLAGHINPHSLCGGIYMELIDSDKVYKTILGVKPNFKGLLLPVASFPVAQLADRVNSYYENLEEGTFPKVQDLSLVTIGTAIALPTVFDKITHLSVEAINLNGYVGNAVVLGCPRLTSLAISFPSGNSLGTRRGAPMPPWTGPSAVGMPFQGAMDFLDALPADRLTNFEMGLWTPMPMPKINAGAPGAPHQREADHLREVGLAYEPARMLLQSLARHKSLKSLGLLRMDPEAYVDLPLLVNLEFSLEKLYIFLPDRVWGNQFRQAVPTLWKSNLVKWIKSLKLLRSLRWVSLDDRQYRGWGIYWAWTEVLAYSISRDYTSSTTMKAPFGLQALEELHLVIGQSRVELFFRIEDLINLEVLHVDVVPLVVLNPWAPPKIPSNIGPHALATAIVRLPKIRAVTLNYAHFQIGHNFFPWPCTNSTLRRGVLSNADYVRSLDGKVHLENHALRKIYIKGDGKEQGMGIWKFLSYFPEVNDVILDIHHDFNPENLFKWLRATNVGARDVENSKIRLYFNKHADNWMITPSKAKVIEEHVEVNTEAEQMAVAVTRMPNMSYAIRSLKFA